jgi:hypothetical protein
MAESCLQAICRPGARFSGSASSRKLGDGQTRHCRVLGKTERMLVSGWENEIYDRRAFLDAAKRCPK